MRRVVRSLKVARRRMVPVALTTEARPLRPMLVVSTVALFWKARLVRRVVPA